MVLEEKMDWETESRDIYSNSYVSYTAQSQTERILCRYLVLM